METAERLTENSSRITNRRGKTLFCKYYEPSNSREEDEKGKKYPSHDRSKKEENTRKSFPRALVFMAHGYGEHCLMYEPLGQMLVNHNYYVVTHDHVFYREFLFLSSQAGLLIFYFKFGGRAHGIYHRKRVGHGQSDGPRVLIDSFDKYVDDVFFHLEAAKEKFPNLPVYICGHSMGGAIAILAALERPRYFGGLVLIAPAVKTDPKLTTPFKISMAKKLRKLFPTFPVATLDLSLLCSCPATVKIMRADPLRYQGFCKAGFGASLIEAMQKIEENVKNVHLPFLLLQGEADKVITPAGAEFFYKNAQSPDKILKTYPRAYHSLLYEPNGVANQVKHDIIEWLNARIRPRESPVKST